MQDNPPCVSPISHLSADDRQGVVQSTGCERPKATDGLFYILVTSRTSREGHIPIGEQSPRGVVQSLDCRILDIRDQNSGGMEVSCLVAKHSCSTESELTPTFCILVINPIDIPSSSPLSIGFDSSRLLLYSNPDWEVALFHWHSNIAI